MLRSVGDARKEVTMVVKIINGLRIHAPPYTKAEEDEFYRRVGSGPVTNARPAGDRKAPKSPKTAAAVAGKTAPLLRACCARSGWPRVARSRGKPYLASRFGRSTIRD